MKNQQDKIAIIGLGYVGLPLAVEFSTKYNVIGFDTNQKRINDLKSGIDKTLEIKSEDLKKSCNILFTSDDKFLSQANIFIVTVPTPINKHKEPDISLLLEASKTVGQYLKSNDLVIYESTVYPGATEEDCVPVLEKYSKLKFNTDFFVGYSPERINPGDKNHTLTNIIKVTSGSTLDTATRVNKLYESIITAGTFKASSIKVAEAAKVIENTQRDVNIALINELAIIFNRFDIDTEEVLEAAGTKWNFLPFRPGLVGGHCIGVDPYYLTFKAQSTGYNPEIILAGRRLNDDMSSFISEKFIKEMSKKNIKIQKSKILIMGLSFKENCPDIRNTKVIDIVRKLEDYGACVDVYDPWVSNKDAYNEYSIKLIDKLNDGEYHGILIAVGHTKFKDLGVEKIRSLCKPSHYIFDLKYLFSQNEVDGRL